MANRNEAAQTRRRSAYRSGHHGEWLAAVGLNLKGYRILARRYRTRLGEIDLIARRGGVLAFVEVKRRSHAVAAIEAVTPKARTRIRRAAELFLQRNPALSGLVLRFDVMVITPWRWPQHLVDAWRDE